MRKETDINKMKSIMKSLLYTDIENTEYSPLIVQHPIFSSGFLSCNERQYDFTNYVDFLDACDIYAKHIDNFSSLEECFMLLRSPYYMTFLKFAKPYLSHADFSKFLGTAWTEEECVNTDINVPLNIAARWFRSADKTILMQDSEYNTYCNLSNSLTVYRGVTTDHNPNGMSWTRDKSKAEWFANRFGKGYVLEGVVEKENVLAFFNRRNEEELVIPAKYVKNQLKHIYE